MMNLPELWSATYRILEGQVVPMQLNAWIQPLEPVRTESSPSGILKLTLSAPNDFSARWVRDHYRSAIETAASQVTGARCEVQLESGILTSETPAGATTQGASLSDFSGQSSSHSSSYEIQDEKSEPVDPFENIGEYQESSPLSLQPASVRVQKSGGPQNAEIHLDPRYTFETFVVGASNQFAHASAAAVAEHPARQYNPLFLYSQPGLGKTHLCHAIGNYVLTRNPKARVAYLSAERFMNELIESIQHKRMTQFRTKYRDSFDLILIDDIQFIAGKKQTEEEFFHTFNALHSSKRQIVVTSDRPPKEIEGLEERIRTRFEWGMVADIQPPEIETRIAILKAKAERDDIYLPDDVATFLATYIKSSVRELEGKLIKLQMQASLTGSEISLEMAKLLLKNELPEEGSHYTVESIQAAVAKHFGIRVQDLKAETRARKISFPRQIAMYLIRKYTGIGLKDIGSYFSGRDHSTVVHACDKIEQGLETDESIRAAVESIQNLL